MGLKPEERVLVGSWLVAGGKVTGDDVCRRIKNLVQSELKKIGSDASGWDILFQDPADGRFWERVFPQSEMHGGGPPTLRNISIEDARKKYGLS